MNRRWQTRMAALAGFFLTSTCAMPQADTISAKAGGVNYIQGQAYMNRQPLSQNGLKSTFLNAGDSLSTDAGKAEILLTPGVFLRIGDNSAVRMISPSLTATQVEVTRGEAMLEVAGLTKENNIQLISHGASVTILKNGLYRFDAGDPPTAATIDGKVQVYFGQEKIDLGRGRQTVLSEKLKAAKFDTKKEDELYAWSNVRSQYNAAVSYQSASAVSAGTHTVRYGHAGYGPGWFWNGAYDTWAWLPGSGAYCSPFGWAFYSPGAVTYAPVVAGPVYRGGHWDVADRNHRGDTGQHGKGDGDGHHHRWIGAPTNAMVPVDVNRPPAIGAFASSPASNHAARAAAAQSFADTGFRTATGAPVATFSGRHESTFPSGTTPHPSWDGAGPVGWSGTPGAGPGADASTAHPNGRWSGDHRGGAGWSGGHGGSGDWPGRGGQTGGRWSGSGDGSGRWPGHEGHAGGGGSSDAGRHAGGDGSHPGGAPSGAGAAHAGPQGR
jgi:hypothetical protein